MSGNGRGCRGSVGSSWPRPADRVCGSSSPRTKGGTPLRLHLLAYLPSPGAGRAWLESRFGGPAGPSATPARPGHFSAPPAGLTPDLPRITHLHERRAETEETSPQQADRGRPAGGLGGPPIPTTIAAGFVDLARAVTSRADDLSVPANQTRVSALGASLGSAGTWIGHQSPLPGKQT